MTNGVDAGLTLDLSRRLAASRERVFDAWLTRDWGEWLPPAGATSVVTEMDARVGGGYKLDMRMGDGRTVHIAGTYREIDRPNKLVLTWKGDYSPDELVITLTFEADGDGTLLKLHQEGFGAVERRDSHRSGWSGEGGSFDKLARVLND